MRIKVKVQGFKEFEKALAEEFPKATARNILTRTAKNAMERIRTKMANLAPYDPQDLNKDGEHLSESMKTQTVKSKRQSRTRFARSSGVEVMTGPAPLGRLARSNAGWQEYGTVKMQPTSYARAAADSESDAVIAEVRDELAIQVGKARDRIARKAARQKGR